jgi:hypothetical protein
VDPLVFTRLKTFVTLLMQLSFTYSHHEVAVINRHGEMVWGQSFWANIDLALPNIRKKPSRSPYMAAAKRGVLQLLVLFRPWLEIFVTPMLRTVLEDLCPWAGGVGVKVSPDENLAMTTSRFAAIVDRLISALMQVYYHPLDLNIPGLQLVGVLLGAKAGTDIEPYRQAAHAAGLFFNTYETKGKGVTVVWQFAPGIPGKQDAVVSAISKMVRRKFKPAPWNPSQSALIVSNGKAIDGVAAMGVTIV